ncbi:hypothetical protein [Nakamurella leprariae]|uniref:Uncharacterized protein n=1 Tax=Nakamurella leprariae TaxID=2803911 RepID=A0A938YIT4_9ACTN|nr:hypothetical protein [Nakamurella leprariae]MBM9469087.1 hypothetical protein [Nakamurella leprariae]
MFASIEIAALVLGALLILAAGLLLGRANRGRRLRWWWSADASGVVRPWAFLPVQLVGIVLFVFGASGLQDRLGWWSYPVALAGILVCSTGPVLVHNARLHEA